MESEELEPVAKSFSFCKNERLRSKKIIQKMFASKSSDFIYPFKFIYQPIPSEDSPTQVLASVPKKIFKRSVDRHLVARRIKEAYRLNKHHLSSKSPYTIILIYVAKDILSFKEIEKKLYLAIQRINNCSNENKS